MTMSEWAKREVEIACKKENPKWDGKSFDYGCACYQSALKAYQSLCEDEHSGMSFNIAKNILIRLMEGNPLTPIIDEDFFIETTYFNGYYYAGNGWIDNHKTFAQFIQTRQQDNSSYCHDCQCV